MWISLKSQLKSGNYERLCEIKEYIVLKVPLKESYRDEVRGQINQVTSDIWRCSVPATSVHWSPGQIYGGQSEIDGGVNIDNNGAPQSPGDRVCQALPTVHGPRQSRTSLRWSSFKLYQECCGRQVGRTASCRLANVSQTDTNVDGNYDTLDLSFSMG